MQQSLTHLPDVLLSQVSSYLRDEVDAADPRCFRSATRIQAQFRAWLIRTHGNPADYAACTRCGDQLFATPNSHCLPTDMCAACDEYFLEWISRNRPIDQ